jgi:hypothetical protein
MDQVKKTHKGNLELRYSLPYTPSSRLCMLAMDLVVHILSIIKLFTFFLNQLTNTQSPPNLCSGALIPTIQDPAFLSTHYNIHYKQIAPPSTFLVNRVLIKK